MHVARVDSDPHTPCVAGTTADAQGYQECLRACLGECTPELRRWYRRRQRHLGHGVTGRVVKLTRSFGSTTMPSGTLKGATAGQNGLLTSCATATDEVAVTETADGELANGLGRITSGRGSLSLLDVARKAATTRSGTRWCTTLPPF